MALLCEKKDNRNCIISVILIWQRTHKMIQTQRRFFDCNIWFFLCNAPFIGCIKLKKWLQHKIKKCNTLLFNATQNKKCNTKKWSTQLQVLKLSASFFSIIDVKCVDFYIPFIGQDFFCFLVEFFVGFEVKVFSFFGAGKSANAINVMLDSAISHKLSDSFGLLFIHFVLLPFLLCLISVVLVWAYYLLARKIASNMKK